MVEHMLTYTVRTQLVHSTFETLFHTRIRINRKILYNVDKNDSMMYILSTHQATYLQLY